MVQPAFILAAAVAHPANWLAGWMLILAAFVAGAVIGLGSHRDDFLGGYTTYRRRMVRLGHIALAALGMLNVLFALSPSPAAGTSIASAASSCFIAGAVLMPAVCFLAAWQQRWRRLFALPVVSLLMAVVLTLIGGWS